MGIPIPWHFLFKTEKGKKLYHSAVTYLHVEYTVK